jgi:transmembrane sensor
MMTENESQSRGSDPDSIAGQAALWLARRDRGLSPSEQDEYLQWLGADPRNVEALAQHAAAFERMMRLYEWQPGHSAEPNPDLFAPPRRHGVPAWGWGLAAAAAIALGGIVWWQTPERKAPAMAQKSHLRVNERHALSDGSVVELKDGSRIAVDFSAERRQVRLAGEAHFKVAHEPARPFVVDAGGVLVRAVGTAFNVRIDSDAVQVLVTEGRVRVQSPAQTPGAALAESESESSFIVAGQRAVVTRLAAASPQISDVSALEIAEALDWQAPRLQFFETPLAAAITEFNAHNRMRLVLAEPELGTVPIGGTFRVDNVEGFVRLLEATLDIRVKARTGDEIVLVKLRSRAGASP